MAQINGGNYNAIAWVQTEVQQSLADALQRLTRFIDDPQDIAVIEPCITQLHQVTGIMEMLDLQGALQLSQEMLSSATAIRGNQHTNNAALQDSLLKGLLLLPNYLKQIGPDISDHPLRVLDTINELRLGRDEHSITAESLFNPSLSVPLPNEMMPKPHEASLKSNITADKISHAFQIALVNWLKTNDQASLEKLAQVVHYLRLSCSQERSIILWWVAEGVIEALQDGGLAVDTKTKLSLGKLNEPIKLLTKHDEQYFLSLFPTELVQQLLLHVAQATSHGPHVSLLKKTFTLDFFDQQLHRRIYSFTDNAFIEVRTSILEQIIDVKEQLNQFDRNDDTASNILEELVTQLTNLASSLDLIAEETASKQLAQQSEILSAILARNELPDNAQVMSLADNLLHVENQLLHSNSVSTQQHHQDDPLQRTVIDECLNELANIKETLILIENKQSDSTDAINQITTQLIRVAGSATMLNLNSTADLLENTAEKITSCYQHNDTITDKELALFAELISATELYLEGLGQHGQQQTQLLDHAHHQLQHFDQLVSSETIIDQPITENDDDAQIIDFINAISIETTVDHDTQQLETVALAQSETSVDRYIQQLETAEPAQPETTVDYDTQQLETVAPAQSETSVDRYIQLLETAEPAQPETTVDYDTQQLETVAPDQSETSVDRYIQLLETAEPAQPETTVDHDIQQLETVAPDQSETSVDRYIQQLETAEPAQPETTVDHDIQQLETVAPDQSETSVDRYIQQLETAEPAQPETTVDYDTQQLETVAPDPSETSVDRYIQRLEIAVPVQTEQKPNIGLELADIDLPLAEQPDQIVMAFAEGIDPDIAEVFIEEADEVMAELKTLIPHWQANQDSETLATLRRHFHTLKGSGRMAGADVIGDLSWSVEDTLNRVIEGNIANSASVEQLISDSQRLIPDLLTRFMQGDTASTDGVAELITLAKQIINAADADNLESIDTELLQIFSDEAMQYITAFKTALLDATSPYRLDKAILHISHSLKGCANVADVKTVASVATALDACLRTFYDNDITLNEDQLTLLNKTVDELAPLISDAANAHQDDQRVVDLLKQLSDMSPDKQLADGIQRIDPETLTVFLEETGELFEQYELLRQQLAQLPDDPDYKTAIRHTLLKLNESAEHAQLPLLIEFYQSLMQLTDQADISEPALASLLDMGSEQFTHITDSLIQNQNLPDISDFKTRVATYFEQLNNHSAEPANDGHEPEMLLDNTVFSLPEIDMELLEAFTEECAELLESSGFAIKKWQADPSNNDAAQQLQRDLHTLKGGARLTAMTPIADLTHHTESLALMASDHKCETDATFFNLLQRCQDRLADMQDQLSHQTNIMLADDLITEIHQFMKQHDPDSTDLDITQLIPTISPVNDSETAPQAKSSSGEQVRVKAELLDFLTNFAGEVNISRDRVSQQNTAMRQQLSEMESTVERLQGQLRKLEMETEAQILFRYEDRASQGLSEFDPLELDRFSQMQQLSRGLTESVTDLHDITYSIENLVRESDTILLQQSRLSTDLQQGLMNTRLLPFSGLVPRFERIVRQTNTELDKQSELIVYGADRELDRAILDHIVAPIEHILRNAISHGIESQEQRQQSGKNEVAQLTLTITRDGSEILITLSDDGRGIDVEKIRQKAIASNLINPDKMPSDDELIQLILHSGFSTADDVSQLAGRGVGMDVVNSEIRALKGRLSIQSVQGQGTSFNIRLPLTLSVMQSLLVGCADEQYAIPLASVHAGDRIAIKDIKELLAQGEDARYEFNGIDYHFMALATLLNQPFNLQDDHAPQLPLLLFNSGEVQVALLVDSINSNREIVLKSVGEQLGHIEAINGATILGDGQVVFVLDIPSLVNTVDKKSTIDNLRNSAISTLESSRNRLPIAMVVDDSITMRKASGNLLKRHGFEVITARDGIDAVALLHEQMPDIILLDVEMPRMDGFEFATLVKNDDQFSHLPIIMITSRTGEKHRNRARDIGVNAYLGKPYQEGELVDTLQGLMGSQYPNPD